MWSSISLRNTLERDMSQYYKFDIDDALWENEVEEKPKAKKLKQRRVDVKRRYADDYAELDFEVKQYH